MLYQGLSSLLVQIGRFLGGLFFLSGRKKERKKTHRHTYTQTHTVAVSFRGLGTEDRGWACACYDIWDMFCTQIEESEKRVTISSFFGFLKPKSLFVRLFSILK